MNDEMAIVVGKYMATGSFTKSFSDIELEEHSYLEFVDVSLKGKDAASSDLTSTKRLYRKRSRDDSEDSYNVISKQLKEATLALKALNKGVDVKSTL
jgi:hypothetical protein